MAEERRSSAKLERTGLSAVAAAWDLVFCNFLLRQESRQVNGLPCGLRGDVQICLGMDAAEVSQRCIACEYRAATVVHMFWNGCRQGVSGPGALVPCPFFLCLKGRTGCVQFRGIEAGKHSKSYSPSLCR